MATVVGGEEIGAGFGFDEEGGGQYRIFRIFGAEPNIGPNTSVFWGFASVETSFS